MFKQTLANGQDTLASTGLPDKKDALYNYEPLKHETKSKDVGDNINLSCRITDICAGGNNSSWKTPLVVQAPTV